MRRYRLKISEEDYQELQRLVFADLPKEAGAFLLAGSGSAGAVENILVRRVVPVAREHFITQHEYRLEVSAQAVNGLVALCEANGIGAVICHSHPEAIPYSPSDDHGERRILDVLREFIPPGAPTASLLLYPGGMDARVWLPGCPRPVPIDEVLVIGRAIRRPLLRGARGAGFSASEIYSRQVLAFGTEGQRLVSSAKTAVVGVGGTGSACAEQLIRLGVKDLRLIDYDRFESSNLTRVYGSVWADPYPRLRWPWRKPLLKAEIVRRHLARISPEAKISLVSAHVAETRAAEQLLDRDLIFICTDDHWGRSVVNQISYQYLIPSINLGVRIDSNNGEIIGASGGVDVLRPGLPCLWCKQFLSPDRIAAECMPVGERQRRAREGYVEGVTTPAPSVISMNTTLAGLAVSTFLQLLTDFMGEQGSVSRLNYDVLSGAVSRGGSRRANPCVCGKFRGFGRLRPLPTVDVVRSQSGVAVTTFRVSSVPQPQ